MYNRKELKREAKKLMRESKPHYMLVALVFLLLTSGLTYAVGFLTQLGGLAGGVLGVFLNILIALFGLVLSVGFAYFALNLARGKSTSMGDLFEGFSFAGRSIGMNLLILIYAFLWTMLGAVVVGVITGLSSFVYRNSPVLAIVMCVIVWIAMIVYSVIIVLRYEMAQFALAENPEAGARAAIRRSVQTLKGNKGKLFVLELSFIGWALLILLIMAVVMCVGLVITGVDWAMAAVSSAAVNPLDVYAMAEELIASMTLWTLIGEVLSLPITMWLLVYQQVAFARFYNFVGGYDNRAQLQEDVRQDADEPALSQETPVEEAVVTPPGGYYTPVPELEEQKVSEDIPEAPSDETDEPEEEI